MVNNDVVIVRKDTLYRFYFRAVSTFKPSKSQPVIVAPLINVSAANTFLFRFFGPSETVEFSFVIFDDGTDVSQGTYTSTVTTIKEQCQYLKDEIFNENYDVAHELYELRDLIYPVNDKIKGVITDVSFDMGSKASVFVPGNLKFQRGNIGDI